MGDKTDALLKALEARVAGLERTLDTMKKATTALPDGAKFVALEKQVALLATAVAGKKDMKPEHEQLKAVVMKQVAEQQALNKEQVTKALLDARFNQVDAQLKQLQAQVNGVAGMAQGALQAANAKK